MIPWIVFSIVVVAMLALDLGLLSRHNRELTVRQALAWSVVWVVVALVFNLWIYYRRGDEIALAFLTGYLIERSLSVDNVFVFYLVFSYFSVPHQYQRKVLLWGVIGALVMRAVLIALGIALITRFHWVVFLFGALLVFTGVRMAIPHEKEVRPERNPVLRLLKRFVPTADHYGDGSFILREAGRRVASPLFVVLVLIETTDLVFAIDSIPAILAITTDPFVVYTSNVFAILGLRALYFVLAGVLGLFEYLHYGLAAVLVFVGIKMLVSDFYKIPVLWSLAIIVAILGVSMVISVLVARKKTVL